MFRCLDVQSYGYISILLLSYCVSTVTLALHNTIILIITHIFIFNHAINQINQFCNQLQSTDTGTPRQSSYQTCRILVKRKKTSWRQLRPSIRRGFYLSMTRPLSLQELLTETEGKVMIATTPFNDSNMRVDQIDISIYSVYNEKDPPSYLFCFTIHNSFIFLLSPSFYIKSTLPASE